MGKELIIPEIVLIEKLEQMDNTLPVAAWQQLKNGAQLVDKSEKHQAIDVRMKKKMLLSDFVNKAINLPLEITPNISKDAERQLTRLHLFCCQQAVHNKEVRHNPLVLGFRALEEMQMALTGILISYRLIHPECPYSWNEAFFKNHVVTHKGADGHTIIRFLRPLDEEILNAAIYEDIVTDWLIYRAYDHNGIRTLVDVKNNLLDLPNYQRGGKPSAEFSRFERKMQEKRNKKQEKNNDALELEFRKVLVQNVASQMVEQLLAKGMSATDLLQQAFNGDLSQLISNVEQSGKQKLTEKKEKKAKNLAQKQAKSTQKIENVIAGLLETDEN